MIDARVKRLDPYLDVTLEIDNTTVELGLQSKQEYQRLYYEVRQLANYLENYLDDRTTD